ncbi:MAG: UDP-3-O-acyl-N-acetylglucosamine deacetylase [Bacteroidales bacterium]|jgi:UDP-3-O-[3-hydroxymyristoyl] N-acetylglucosamine deacetylase/3-hydroxyacyl-[acyl-carrier-protein] dehydratase|nr:UDP-3-O-acyl-N-acetylglucosamine deacetylase [Bacteroidales bacterium]
MEYQSTIGSAVSFSGNGLHSGKPVTMTLLPAPENHGIVFQRIDLPDKTVIHACVHNVCDTSHSTTLTENGAVVRTIEHLMAALAGLAIDNVLIEIDSEETPILDGSSKIYVDFIQKVGIQKQAVERQYYVFDKEIVYKKEKSDSFIMATPALDFKIEIDVDYQTAVLGKQSTQLLDIKYFCKEFYDARTFVFLHELQFLIQHNLVRGGDVDNAVVFVAHKPEQAVLDQLALFFNKKDIDINENGTLNHNSLKYENEPARHKLLDLLGDLYLLGKPIKGHIKAFKPGHFINTEFVKLFG